MKRTQKIPLVTLADTETLPKLREGNKEPTEVSEAPELPRPGPAMTE